MGNPRSVHQLRRWSNHYAPDIIFLSETMIKKNEAEVLKEQLSFKNAFAVASQGRSLFVLEGRSKLHFFFFPKTIFVVIL